MEGGWVGRRASGWMGGWVDAYLDGGTVRWGMVPPGWRRRLVRSLLRNQIGYVGDLMWANSWDGEKGYLGMFRNQN